MKTRLSCILALCILVPPAGFALAAGGAGGGAVQLEKAWSDEKVDDVGAAGAAAFQGPGGQSASALGGRGGPGWSLEGERGRTGGGGRGVEGEAYVETSSFYTCPLNDNSQAYIDSRNAARGVLGELSQVQRECAEATGIDGNIAAARTALSNELGDASEQRAAQTRTTCESSAVRSQRRVTAIRAFVQGQGVRPASPEQLASVSELQLQGSWVTFESGSSLPDTLQPLQGSCLRPGGQSSSGFRVWLINLECVDRAAEIEAGGELLDARATGRPDNGSCARPALLNETTAQALMAAMSAWEGMLNNPQCETSLGGFSGFARVLTSLPLGVNGELLGAAVNFFTQVFTGSRARNAEAMLQLGNADDVRRASQCMYNNLNQQRLGCGQRVDRQNQESLVNLTRERGQVQALHPTLDFEQIQRSCLPTQAPAPTAFLSNMVRELKLEDLANALVDGDISYCQRNDEGELHPGVSGPHLRAGQMAMSETCRLYRDGRRTRLASYAAQITTLSQLDTICDVVSPSRALICDTLTAGGSGIVIDSEFAAQADAVSRSVASAPTGGTLLDSTRAQSDCEQDALGAAYADYQRWRNLQVNIDELRRVAPTSSGAEVSQQVISEWGRYHRAFTQPNNTSVNLRSALADTYDGSGTNLGVNSNVVMHCASRDSESLKAAVKELHAICLLNASVFLYPDSGAARLDTAAASATGWRERCAPFLDNPRYAPVVSGAALTLPIEADAYGPWQCEASRRYSVLRSNIDQDFSTSLPGFYETFCGAGPSSRSPARGARGR